MENPEFIHDVFLARCKDTLETPHPEDIEELRRRISSGGKHALVLRECRLGINSAISIAKNLKDSRVHTLDLCGNLISDIGSMAILQLAHVNACITHLNLEANDISNEGASAIAQELKTNTSLRELHLGSLASLWHDNNILGEGAIKLAQALQLNTTLTFLGLNRNKIFVEEGEKVAVAFARMLQRNPSLETLELADTGLTNRALVPIARVLQEANRSIKALDLSQNKLTHVGAYDIAQALTANHVLETLNLSGNPIGGRGTDEIAAAMKFNTGLTTLDLSNCGVGDFGIYTLATSLRSPAKSLEAEDDDYPSPPPSPRSTSASQQRRRILPPHDLPAGRRTPGRITSLNVSHCGIGPKGCAALAACLDPVRNPLCRIRTLAMNTNPIQADGARFLAGAIARNTTLVHLDLCSCKIDDLGALAIGMALSTNRSVTHLQMRANFLSDEIGQQFIASVSSNTTLATLDVRGSLLSRNVIQDINAVCRRNTQARRAVRPKLLQNEIYMLRYQASKLPGVQEELQDIIEQSQHAEIEEHRLSQEIRSIEMRTEMEANKLRKEISEQQEQINDRQKTLDEKLEEAARTRQLTQDKKDELEQQLLKERNVAEEVRARLAVRTEELNAIHDKKLETLKEMSESIARTRLDTSTLRAKGEEYRREVEALIDRGVQPYTATATVSRPTSRPASRPPSRVSRQASPKRRRRSGRATSGTAIGAARRRPATGRRRTTSSQRSAPSTPSATSTTHSTPSTPSHTTTTTTTRPAPSDTVTASSTIPPVVNLAAELPEGPAPMQSQMSSIAHNTHSGIGTPSVGASGSSNDLGVGVSGVSGGGVRPLGAESSPVITTGRGRGRTPSRRRPASSHRRTRPTGHPPRTPGTAHTANTSVHTFTSPSSTQLGDLTVSSGSLLRHMQTQGGGGTPQPKTPTSGGSARTTHL